MRTSWLKWGVGLCGVGILFVFTLVGAAIGGLLMIIGLLLVVVGIFLPENEESKKTEIHIHHHNESEK